MSISASGIEQAIAGLNYRNPAAIKARLLDVIKQQYDGLESPEKVHRIAADDLVQKVWDIEPTLSAIQSKKKNLSSIKSSINADLETAWREGRNPEGIIIGPDNTFTMSNEAKDKMIAAFSGAVSADGVFKMDEVSAALKLVSEFLSSRPDAQAAGELQKLKALIEKVTEETGSLDLSGYDVTKREGDEPRDGAGSGEKPDRSAAGALEKLPGGPVAGESVAADGMEQLDPAETRATGESAASDEAGEAQDAGREALSSGRVADVLDLGTADEAENFTDTDVIPGEEALEEGGPVEEEIGAIPESTLEAVADLVDLDEVPEIEEIEEIEVAADEEIEAISEDTLEGGEDLTEPDQVAEFEEVDGLEEMEETEDVEILEEDDIVELLDEADEPIEPVGQMEVAEQDDLEEISDEILEAIEALSDPDEVAEIEAVDDLEEMEVTEDIEMLQEDDIVELFDETVEPAPSTPPALDDDAMLREEDALELVEEIEEWRPGAPSAAKPGTSALDSQVHTDTAGNFADMDGLAEVEEVEEAEMAEEDEIEEIPDDILEVVEDFSEADELPEIEALEEIEETEEVEILEEDAIAEIPDEEAQLTVEALAALDEDFEVLDEEDLEFADETDKEGSPLETHADGNIGPNSGVPDKIEGLVDKALSNEGNGVSDEAVSVAGVGSELHTEEDLINGVDELVKKLLMPAATEPPAGNASGQTGDWMRNVGLPVEMFDEDGIDFDNLEKDTEKKKVLAARFDGYLGVMERYYNQLITIPEGDYVVGGKDDLEDELPFQRISLSEYYIGKFPVTNAVFEIFIDRTGYVTTAEKLGYGFVYYGRFQKIVDDKTGRARSVWNPAYTRKKIEGASWFQPLGPGSSLHNKRNHPVVQVSLKDAKSFAAWTGKRLPTEIEWEAAARTKDGRRWPWGDQWQEYLCNTESSGISDTTAVTQYPGGDNPLGISDLLGNVMEWTCDPCEPKFDMERKTIYYITKGGGWIADNLLTLSSRFRVPADFSSNLLGFRCVVD